MGQHDGPYTGTGKRHGNGPKPKKAQIAQRGQDGNILWRLTAKLWGSPKHSKDS